MMMKKLLLILPILLVSCGTVKEIPVKEIEKIVVKDSVVFVKDTVEVKVPVEVKKEVMPVLDTSYLFTDLAESTAYVDTSRKVIIHNLSNIPKVIEQEIERPEKIVTVEKVVEKEKPVKVPEPYIPTWCWWLLVLNVGYFGIKLSKVLFIR